MFPRRIPYNRAMSNLDPQRHDAEILILGAGPAGMLCALTAARRFKESGLPKGGQHILLVDQGRETGRKLRASGGGRCNCTNQNAAPAHYLSKNQRFTAQALARFTPAQFLDLLAGLGLSAHEEDQGKMFCDQGAAALCETLEKACRKAGCRFLTGRAVTAVTPPAEPGGAYRVETEHGPLLAQRVVLALGSPAWPALGGTDIIARLAGQLGLPHAPARPALTPLELSGPEGALCRELSGLSVIARLSLAPDSASGGAAYTDGLLFTHQGLSGPAALQISSHWRRGEAIRVDLAPQADVPALLREPGRAKSLARSVIAELLPRRLAEARLAALPTGLADRRLAELSRAELTAITELLTDWRITPKGTAGMARAEAASGGLGTEAFSAKTMQCKSLPGLFAIGEALDVAGELGGYNLHWAWASGFAAGQAL
ncbi:MAG: aminoacetone oxidase family FAD-binding enzyme [Humidesulfovibrio sp.]|nr:aminoacetone oxidase family FAD-binding enzyme [Humidesulfovibrio sp.]